MTKAEVLSELKKLGSEQTKKTLLKHGAIEPFWGVKIGDMKPLVKKIKKDYELSKELYDSGISDAMYFAGLIADETKMTKADLDSWVKAASWNMISEYTVPWIAAESDHGWELGLKWIDSKNEKIAASGWNTLASLINITENDELDIPAISKLLDRVIKEIHKAPNRVKCTMNVFLIAVGGGIPELTPKAIADAKKIGVVTYESEGTACKVPSAVDYIEKIKKMGRLGKKKKMARC
jgi:3-methyladenine DNA glycosylase AlkD